MSFSVALSGLNAASTDLQVTSNNIANANTVGFKASRAEFADVFSSGAVGIGNGVRLTEVRQQFTQGNVDITARQLDLAISGNGFFITSDGGGMLYSRAGAFGLNAQGYVENSEGERLQVYAYVPTTNTFQQGSLTDLRITTDTAPPIATTQVDMAVNLRANAPAPSVTPFDPAIPESYADSTSTVAYDSRGVAHTVTYYFIPDGAGWEVAMAFDGNLVGTPQAMTFTDTGTVATPANGRLNFGTVNPTGATPMDISLDVSRTTSYGDNFVVISINPNGQAEGRLRNIEIDETGVVFARFSNGQSTPLGKIALADFSNPEGLSKVSDTSYQETFSSGIPQLGEATESTFGLIQSGALESSNVDLTEQLVKLITAQRLFQANAQVISATDEITQTIINIR